MEDDLVKQKVQSLIDDFRSNYNEYKKESEASIETKLIEPLFKCLGWTEKDFSKRERTQREGKLGFADYTFYIKDKKVFFLEVKKIGVPLDKEADAQVVSYALSKSVSIAISTNFEQLKVFCVEEENLDKRMISIFKTPEDYLDKFYDLILLSKSSFEQDLLMKKAEDLNLLKKRITIDKPLLDNLILIRKFIADDIEKKYSGKYQPNEKEEIIQRIIDRLIFIRKCEDTGINPENLTLKDVLTVTDEKAYKKLKEIFEEYNTRYNSGLFAIDKDNECDRIQITGDIIKKLIGYLYISRNGGYHYNFEWIPADILGQVYEQYLGKILEQTKSGKAKLTNGQVHRKEQGIYYTPTFVVDYIVKTTVGEVLKNKKVKVKELKILDPACGSGSFLIKAFDYIYRNQSTGDSQQYRIDGQGQYSVKTEILKNNLYGVDLDNKAIEITKLNLLLKAAEKGRRLPVEIDINIRQGNSLIDDESIAGLNAFKWTDKTKNKDNRKFDVVIGNPPYIKVEQIKKEEKEWIYQNFENATGRTDLYVLFLEKALELTKDDGLISFIIPSIWMKAKYGEKLRENLVRNYQIKSIIDFGDLKVFESVTTYPCIILIKKKKPTGNDTIIYYKVPSLNESIINNLENAIKKDSWMIRQKEFDWNFANPQVKKIFDKLNKSSKIRLSDLRDQIYEGLITGDNKAFFVDRETVETKNLERELLKPVPKGKNIRRFSIRWEKEYVIYPYKQNMLKTEPVNIKEYPNVNSYLAEFEKKLTARTSIKGTNKKWFEHVRPREKWWFEKQKILTPNLSSSNNFAIDEGRSNEYFYVDHDAYAITLKTNSREDLLFICGLLNSSLIEFYIKQISPMFSGGYYKYHTQYLDPIPIIKPSKKEEIRFVKLVERIILLNKTLTKIGDKKTAESAKLEEEIKKVDNQIDELVFDLYHLTKDEKEIIKKS